MILANKWQSVAALKFISLFLLTASVVLVFIWQKQTVTVKQLEPKTGFSSLINQGSSETILSIPYQQTLYKHFGSAINPLITIPIKTINGYYDSKFLVDSGAVVSAMSKVMAEEMGVNLLYLPRITIEGFAGQKTFAYRGEMIVKIGQEEIIIPVVFSENPQANNILGRVGFFDQFTIVFDAETKKIIIRQKK